VIGKPAGGVATTDRPAARCKAGPLRRGAAKEGVDEVLPCPPTAVSRLPRYGERGLAAEPAETLRLAHETRRSTRRRRTAGFRARKTGRARPSSPSSASSGRSHSIADIPSCTIHHPRINATARAVRDAIRSAGIAPYADRPHVGLLRYVQIVVERASGRVQVVLVANDASEQSLLPMAAALVPLLGDNLQGLWWNGNTARSNTIFGPHWRLLAGEEAVRETIGGAEVFFRPVVRTEQPRSCRYPGGGLHARY
jgi:tRNA/tmRNA/rRNA uracil-C5-methylase (TrmA/RlmC/RlmD family)